MPDAFTRSLIGNTDPSPYGQAIFLSQNVINKSFHNMWALTPKRDPPPLREFQADTMNGSIDIVLDAPTVKLMTTTNQDPQLFFILNIKSGTITVYTGTIKHYQSKDFDTTGWTFGFAVKIASKFVDKNDPKYVTSVTNAGFSPDVYSLAQLYLDVSSSTKNSTQYNSYGTYDWSKESPQTHAAFNGFCQNWFDLMKEKGCNVVGYSLQATKVDSSKADVATFLPTSIDYWVYPWKDPEQSYPSLTDGSPNNALCYLMMSDFVGSPSRAGLEYSGTFVKDGALYTMNRDNFWDRWLIPLMQGLNKGAEIIPNEPIASYDPNLDPNWPWKSDISCSIGVSESHGTTHPYYAFTKDGSQAATWTWSGEKKFSSKTVESGGSRSMTCSQTSITSTKLSFDQGGQGVTLQGKTIFTFNLVFNWKGTPERNPSEIEITSEWSFKMGLSSVSDGGVEFACVSTNVSTPAVNATPGSVTWKGGFDDVKELFTNNLNDYLTEDTQDIQNVLLSSLKGQDKLMLPASGTFLMKDPTFNNRGDLLVTLTYNGADPPDPPPASSNMAKAGVHSFMVQKHGITGPTRADMRGVPARKEARTVRRSRIRSGAVTLRMAAS
ncbi:hypothetical protein F5Y16DRAFT_359973 [Xylariaceae sp. FL0255]|nr:hypothetical protein F5Y16DRAFT_359973 [Xylariaceae sp. FL0255]